MVKRLLFRQKLNPCEHTGFFFFSSVLKNILSQLIPCQWPLETPWWLSRKGQIKSRQGGHLMLRLLVGDVILQNAKLVNG